MKAFAAIVRGEDQNLSIRRFATAADAAEHHAARDLEMPPPSQGGNEAVALITRSLPAVLAHLSANQGDRIVIKPRADGGVEVDVIRRNKLFVSAAELAEMLPKFSEATNPKRFVDDLVRLGMPYSAPTGSKIFNVSRCEQWLRRKFGKNGDQLA